MNQSEASGQAQPAPGEYRMERTYEVAATPEQVWEAIATAEGISSWMVPARLDPRVGGEVSFDLGEMNSTGVVTDYSPNTRFAYDEPWPIAERPEDVAPDMAEWFASIGVPLAEVCDGLDAVSPIATEFLVESASGGSCVIRVVTSAYGSGADWEREFFAEMAESLAPILDRLAARFPVAV
ncbi:SRPBCC domain-containing protein [Agromyces sp. G08B096]|uniref:SRPBCC domain-containing protein n=1 Tax=Agromyces sp. G08B096 TaxID=3156399 RepID=A0AAU7W8E0_9MICO